MALLVLALVVFVQVMHREKSASNEPKAVKESAVAPDKTEPVADEFLAEALPAEKKTESAMELLHEEMMQQEDLPSQPVTEKPAPAQAVETPGESEDPLLQMASPEQEAPFTQPSEGASESDGKPAESVSTSTEASSSAASADEEESDEAPENPVPVPSSSIMPETGTPEL